MGGVLAGALAAISLGISQSLDFRNRAVPKRAEPPLGYSHRPRKGRLPNGTSGQKPDKDRLLLDRSSSVHKMRRWLRSGRMEVAAPKTDRHLMRHGWYRRELEKKARATATEAWRAPA